MIFLFNQYVLFRWIVDAGDEAPYAVVLTSMAATTVLWIVVALMTAPEPEDKLVEFYRRARPLGAWGPIARKAGLVAAGWRPIARGFGIAAAGAVMVGAAVVALSLMYVARWNGAAVAIAIGLAAGLAFRRTFIPFVREFETQPEYR